MPNGVERSPQRFARLGLCSVAGSPGACLGVGGGLNPHPQCALAEPVGPVAGGDQVHRTLEPAAGHTAVREHKRRMKSSNLGFGSSKVQKPKSQINWVNAKVLINCSGRKTVPPP